MCSSERFTLFHSVAWKLFNFSNTMEDTFFAFNDKQFTGKSCSFRLCSWPGRSASLYNTPFEEGFALQFWNSFYNSDLFSVLGVFLVHRLLALQLHLRYETVATPLRVAGLVTFIWVFCAFYSSTVLWHHIRLCLLLCSELLRTIALLLGVLRDFIVGLLKTELGKRRV